MLLNDQVIRVLKDSYRGKELGSVVSLMVSGDTL